MRVKCLLIGVFVLFIAGMLTTQGYAEIDVDTIVGMWLFNESSGVTAADSSGNGNDGELIDGPVWVAGKFGNALEFDGGGSHVNIVNSDSLNSDSFTLCLWFQPNELRIQGLADKTPAPNWRLFMNNPGGNIEFDALPGEIGNVTTPGTVTGEWQHVAATYDAGTKTAKIYFNGALSNEAADVDMNTNSPVNINIASPENTRFSGIIDDVGIFNVALEEGDIQTLMNEGLETVFPPSAVDLSGKLVTTWASVKDRY